MCNYIEPPKLFDVEVHPEVQIVKSPKREAKGLELLATGKQI